MPIAVRYNVPEDPYYPVPASKIYLHDSILKPEIEVFGSGDEEQILCSARDHTRETLMRLGKEGRLTFRAGVDRKPLQLLSAVTWGDPGTGEKTIDLMGFADLDLRDLSASNPEVYTAVVRGRNFVSGKPFDDSLTCGEGAIMFGKDAFLMRAVVGGGVRDWLREQTPEKGPARDYLEAVNNLCPTEKVVDLERMGVS